ncbi:MAG: extracellular solute-binding protein [Defluviitaleaceae bacterium]|nr:extracellular solute-binding protein [Defluviitaleaceae bacterium]
MKKLILLPLLVLALAIFAACQPTEGDPEPPAEDPSEVAEGVSNDDAPEAPGGEVAPPERDLGGMVINIANWYQDECTETVEPTNAAERARWDDRRAMEERYNFRVRYVRYGSWDDVRNDVRDQILAQNRDFHVWIVEPTWFASHHGQRLFAPIPMHNFEDDYGIEWNHSILELTMRDGQPHGFASGIEMAGGVYFNMRLLEEAGVPSDLPFTLQRQDNWTWDTFTDMARPLSRDLTGDGIIDTWAITAFHQEVLAHALASNGAAYVVINPETGRFENATNTDAFREALTWVVQLYDENLTFIEDEGDRWDLFIPMFNDSQGAIRVAANYVAGNIFPELMDQWGFVAFPRGPRMDRHYMWVSQNFNVIPHFFDEDEVDDIMFAMRKWIRPLPDDDPDDWILEAEAVHRDLRSVEETMVNFTRNPELHVMPAHEMMPALGNVINENFAWRVWRGNDPSVIIDEAQQVWDTFIERVNNLGE